MVEQGKGCPSGPPYTDWEPWPDNLSLEEQVERLARVLMEDYGHAFDRSEGAIEKATRLLQERVPSTTIPRGEAETIWHPGRPLRLQLREWWAGRA